MIERLHGPVVAAQDKMITVMAGGIGFGVHVPQVAAFALNELATVYTYLHWNAEKGQTLFGFSDEMSRHVFLLLISCQKIGPAIALAILRQRDAALVVQDILAGNSAGLSSCQGIGTKKAEQIIYELKDKVADLAAFVPEASAGKQLHHMQEALLSLSYSHHEAAQAVRYVAHLYKNEAAPDFNGMLRSALAYLSAPRE